MPIFQPPGGSTGFPLIVYLLLHFNLLIKKMFKANLYLLNCTSKVLLFGFEKSGYDSLTSSRLAWRMRQWQIRHKVPRSLRSFKTTSSLRIILWNTAASSILLLSKLTTSFGIASQHQREQLSGHTQLLSCVVITQVKAKVRNYAGFLVATVLRLSIIYVSDVFSIWLPCKCYLSTCPNQI